jgi:hypothetical protein
MPRKIKWLEKQNGRKNQKNQIKWLKNEINL